MKFTNDCIYLDADTNAEGRWEGGYSAPYKSHRIYLCTLSPNAARFASYTIDETNVDNDNELNRENCEPEWEIICEHSALATAICEALNDGRIEVPAVVLEAWRKDAEWRQQKAEG